MKTLISWGRRTIRASFTPHWAHDDQKRSSLGRVSHSNRSAMLHRWPPAPRPVLAKNTDSLSAAPAVQEWMR